MVWVTYRQRATHLKRPFFNSQRVPTVPVGKNISHLSPSSSQITKKTSSNPLVRFSPHRSLPHVSCRGVSDAAAVAPPSSLSPSLPALRYHRRRPQAQPSARAAGASPSPWRAQTLGSAVAVPWGPSAAALLSSRRRRGSLSAPGAGGPVSSPLRCRFTAPPPMAPLACGAAAPVGPRAGGGGRWRRGLCRR